MKDTRSRHVHFSRSTIGVWGVCGIGSVLMFVLPSTEAENAMQVCTYGALAAIVVRRSSKADAVMDAALLLAEQLAHLEPEKSGPRDGLAQVVPLPSQRSKQSEAS